MKLIFDRNPLKHDWMEIKMGKILCRLTMAKMTDVIRKIIFRCLANLEDASKQFFKRLLENNPQELMTEHRVKNIINPIPIKIIISYQLHVII